MSVTSRAAAMAVRSLVLVGVLALAYAAYVVVDAATYQAAAERRFAVERANPVMSSGPAAAVAEGFTIGEIRVPRLGLAAMIVQGDSPAILRRAVGHLADSPLPGEAGNVVLAGHRDTFFRPLQRVQVGDTITLRTRERDFEYRVESTAVVNPDDLGVLAPTGGRTLTLITCFPFSYLGAAPDRFIVRARATDAPGPALPVN